MCVCTCMNICSHICADTSACFGESSLSFWRHHPPFYFERWSFTVLELTKQAQLSRCWASEIYLPILSSLGLEFKVCTILSPHVFWGLDFGCSKQLTDWAILKASPLFWVRGQLLSLLNAVCESLTVIFCLLSLIFIFVLDFWHVGYNILK